MNVNDKYKYMEDFCNKQSACGDCPVGLNYPNHKCVGLSSFDYASSYAVSEEELELCYSIAVKEKVNHPKHYEGNTSLECIECMRVAFGMKAVCDFCLCNAFKYMWRYKNKNGEEDLNKAKWYLRYVQHEIELEGESNFPKELLAMYHRLNDLYIDIWDRISNHAD